MDINICICSDNNYIKYAGVLIASIIKNSSETDVLNFYIINDLVSTENQLKIMALKELKESTNIKFINIGDKDFAEYSLVKTHSYLTLASFYRLKISSLLPDVDKLIYLDCDVIVRKNLAPLFASDMGDFMIAGVKDVASKKMIKKDKLACDTHYINSGMMLLDCKKIREQKIEQEFLNYTVKNAENIKMGDQQIVNFVLQKKIMPLDSHWNVQVSNFVGRSDYTNDPSIIHFTARNKPWIYGSWTFFKMEYFKYLQFTPWKLSEDEKKHWYVKSRLLGIARYIKYRPLFFLRPRFYKALFYTYLKK